MKTKSCLIVALAAGSVFAAQAVAGPEKSKVAKKAPALKTMQTLTAAPVQPQILAWQKVRRLADGSVVPVGPKTPYAAPGNHVDAPTIPAFDRFESDPNSTPPNAPTGATNCGLPADSSRWWFGATFICSNYADDFTVAPAAVGKPFGRIDLGFNWGSNGFARQCDQLIEIYETGNDCTQGTPPFAAANFVDGIVLTLGLQVGGAGYFGTSYTAVDPSGQLLAPVDGTGMTHISLGVFDGVSTFTLDATPGTQMMLWGDRGLPGTPVLVGTTNTTQWDDDGGTLGPQLSDGTFATDECYNSFFGAGLPTPCPAADYVTMMHALWAEDSGSTGPVCYPNCDSSTVNPCLNVGDFACFLNSFANSETYANCDGSTTPPVLNVGDFACFLNAFANGCSACI